jgi:hypothetical protein
VYNFSSSGGFGFHSSPLVGATTENYAVIPDADVVIHVFESDTGKLVSTILYNDNNSNEGAAIVTSTGVIIGNDENDALYVTFEGSSSSASAENSFMSGTDTYLTHIIIAGAGGGDSATTTNRINVCQAVINDQAGAYNVLKGIAAAPHPETTTTGGSSYLVCVPCYHGVLETYEFVSETNECRPLWSQTNAALWTPNAYTDETGTVCDYLHR